MKLPEFYAWLSQEKKSLNIADLARRYSDDAESGRKLSGNFIRKQHFLGRNTVATELLLNYALHDNPGGFLEYISQHGYKPFYTGADDELRSESGLFAPNRSSLLLLPQNNIYIAPAVQANKKGKLVFIPHIETVFIR